MLFITSPLNVKAKQQNLLIINVKKLYHTHNLPNIHEFVELPEKNLLDLRDKKTLI